MTFISPEKDWLDLIVASVQVGTLIALVVYVCKTGQIATASLRSARSAEKQALLNEDTLRQMQVDRILVQKPSLVLTSVNQGMGTDFQLSLFNHGRGPAIDVRHSYDVNSDFALKNPGEQGFSLDVKRDHPLGNVITTNANSEGRTLKAICEFQDSIGLPWRYTVKMKYQGHGANAKLETNPETICLNDSVQKLLAEFLA